MPSKPISTTSDSPPLDMAELPDQTSLTAAVAQLREAEVAYRLQQPSMTDEAFDALAERVASTKAAHPDWDDEGASTSVASGVTLGGDVQHRTPMLSLDKSKNLAEVRAFMASLGSDDEPLVVEVKVDGCAVSAVYQDGVLVQAAQRGDGLSGEDITAQIGRGNGVHGLPTQLNSPWSGEVRGEIFMSDADFETANNLRVAAGRQAFANPRNATSGTLRNLERTYEVPMSFAAYDVSEDLTSAAGAPSISSSGPSRYSLRLDRAEDLGFATARQLLSPELRLPHTNPSSALEAITHIEGLRAQLGFPIDGSLESRLLR